MSDLILRDYSTLTVSAGDRAKELKEAALAGAALIGRVGTAAEQDRAVAAMREIKTLLSGIERARVEVKKPALDFCRDLEALAKSLTKELEDELQRVSSLVSDFQSAELERSREAARKRAEEEERIEREKAAAIAAEQRRVAAEASKAATPQAAEKIIRDGEERIAEVVERSQQALEAATPVAAPAKAEGQMVRPTYTFEVVDIHLLYRSNPGLVRLEPNKREIGEVIARGILSIPGLRVFPVVKVGVRIGGKTEPAAIDV